MRKERKEKGETKMENTKEKRYVWGSRTKRWHEITKDDRDWRWGISKTMINKLKRTTK
ncbi:hypothetical protein KKH23_07840 [Patescibacteria group bacterium]|nr:hypothetical protein [Patescibacteria group bacterium]